MSPVNPRDLTTGRSGIFLTEGHTGSYPAVSNKQHVVMKSYIPPSTENKYVSSL